MKQIFSYFFALLKILSIAKILNLFKLYSSFFYAKITGHIIHKGSPWSLSIETGTSCNLSCLECPSGQKQFSRPTGYLSLQDFKTIIQKQKKYLIWLILYFQGEPYMNRDFFAMVKYAKLLKIFTTSSTNGHFLNKSNAKKTIESGLDQIIISLDGATKETYEKYRIGGDFERVIAGIKTLVSTKKSLKSSHPFIILQFIVFRTNEHEIAKIKQLAKKLGVNKLVLKTAQIYSSDDKNKLLPLEKKYSRYKKNNKGLWEIKKKPSHACLRMWQSAVISWDGNILPCCFDKDGKYNMGNLLESTYIELKQKDKYQKFRKKVFSSQNPIDICQNCPER